MVFMYKRAIRRSYVKKLKKQKKIHLLSQSRLSSFIEKDIQRHIGIQTTTAKICSCYMCGNPRRKLKEKTLHEISHEEYSALFFVK
jgi:hypothetical protein